MDSDDNLFPPAFLCPITHELMQDPVIAVDGHSYSRVPIERWFRNHDTSPMTNEQLTSIQVVPNHTLRKEIEDWQDQNQWRSALRD